MLAMVVASAWLLSGSLAPPANADVKPSPSPSPIVARRIATGGIYNCALRSGKVYCWGLARGHTEGKAFAIPGIDDAVEVAAGYESACARHATGRVTCWDERAQHEVEGVTGSNGIAVGAELACATVGERVACWRPQYRAAAPPVAREVLGVADAIQVAAGFYHACALERGGTVKCWGRDMDGVLGTADDSEPSFDRGTAGADAWVAQAIDFRSGKFDTKAFWKATKPLDQQLARCVDALGADEQRRTIEFEIEVDGKGLVTDVRPLRSQLGAHATEALHRCAAAAWFADAPALRPESGKPATIAAMLFVQTQDGALRTARPVLDQAVALASNGYFTCAVLADTTLQCWGYTHGFDGPGIHGNRLQSPGRPAGIDGVRGLETVSIGWRHICGRRKDGTHLCFGANADGAFGPGIETSAKFVVRDVDQKRDYVEISAGPTMSCGLRKDGTAWCWGINDGGRLGTGDPKPGIRPPARVLGLP